ncbi:MAG: DUF3137 domain-containing protein [Clostridia bacterium]|nr:DUF3137 domain-containing protein [Clostridia bacterium]
MNKFDEIYETIKSESFEELEIERKKANNLRTIPIITSICVSILISLLLHSLIIFPIFIGLFVGFLLSMLKTEYRNKFKNAVIKRFIEEYDSNLCYKPNSGISSSIYDRGFRESYDSYSSDDLIEGMIDNTYPISFAEVHTEIETEDSDGNRSSATVFHGAFACIGSRHNFRTPIMIHSDKGFFGKLFNKKNKIEMDSEVFEKYFDVHAENGIATMQILTSDVMNLMIDFKEKYKTKFEITLNGSNIYIRFYTGSIFEPSLSKKGLDKDFLKKYYDIINFTFDFSKLINKSVNEADI